MQELRQECRRMIAELKDQAAEELARAVKTKKNGDRFWLRKNAVELLRGIRVLQDLVRARRYDPDDPDVDEEELIREAHEKIALRRGGRPARVRPAKPEQEGE